MRKYLRVKSKLGFTMAEITAVVIIAGIFASFATVSYVDYMRKIRSQEARQILTALYGAQMERFREQGAFLGGNLAAINAAPPPLSVTFTQPFRNFKDLTAEAGTARCGAATVGRIVAMDDSYAFHITNQGNIICTDAANTCGTALCQRIL